MQIRGIYIGADTELKGEAALLLVRGSRLLAQFDSHSTGLGYGWHPYAPNDFYLFGIVEPDSLLRLWEDYVDLTVRRHDRLVLTFQYETPSFISPRGG